MRNERLKLHRLSLVPLKKRLRKRMLYLRPPPSTGRKAAKELMVFPDLDVARRQFDHYGFLQTHRRRLLEELRLLKKIGT